MSPEVPPERRRAATRRSLRLTRSLAPWLAVLVCGIVVLAIGSIALASASRVKSDAFSARQQYSRPATASPAPRPAAIATRSAPAGRQKSVVIRPAIPATSSDTAARQPPAHSRPTDLATPRSAQPRTSTVISRPTEPAELPGFVPAFITLGQSHSPIHVVPIGVSSAGVLEPPEDISTVGWWVSGPRPGAQGRAVIAGHIDSPTGLGAFAALDLLDEGDPIFLIGTDGKTRNYRVTDRREIEKTDLDPSLLRHTPNQSDLLLVTCIGTFDYSARSYESNLLVTAAQVGR